jgi:hypothetical protein
MKLGKLGRVAQVVQACLGLDDSRSRDVPEIAKDPPQSARFFEQHLIRFSLNKEDYMTSGDRVTGVRNEHYNLVSILYHALQGAETYDTYISDAESTGDQELTQFFRQVQEEERRRAARAKELLGRKLTQR